MKKKLRSLFTILLLSVFTHQLQAQDRIQSITTGISLLGTSKPKINTYLSNLGFSYNNSNGNLYSYIKRVQFGSNTFMVAYKNQVADAVAWTEHIANLQNVLSEIKSTGFDNGKGVNDSKMYSFKNYRRNILLTLIVREDMNDFQITLGKIIPGKGIVKSDLDNHPTVNTNDNRTNSKYVIIAQKAYFYTMDTKGGVGQKRQAYLVEGEKIAGLKETNGFIYCDFTNSATKKTSKGWLCKMDIEKLSDEVGVVQVNSIESGSPFYSLIKLDGETWDVKKAYSNLIITNVIKKIMGADYAIFIKDFLTGPLVGEVYVRHNVLYINSFVPHNATTNASFFIDLKEGKSFLYWNTFDKSYNDLIKTYGDTPLSPSIVYFIQQQKIDMKDFMDENGVKAFDNILKYQ